MSTLPSETAWLCLAVMAALGGLVLCQLKMSSGQVRRKVVCLGGLWGGACLLSLSLFWGLVLFSLSCFLLYIYLSGQELLPVDQKAVLITESFAGMSSSHSPPLQPAGSEGKYRVWMEVNRGFPSSQRNRVGGSDSGFGHALSKYLDQLGFTVFAGVLDENGPGAEQLRRTCSKHLCVLQMDVTNPQQIKDAYSTVVQKVQNRGLWAVINNAGILSLPADGELIPMSHYKQCMAVNFFGAVEVTKAFLPLLRKSKGRLVNVSSMAGEIPFLKLAAYGSSKAALTMFSAIMRQELAKWEVKVSIIQPGGFKTNITGTREMLEKLEKDMLDYLTPDVQEEYGQDYILAQRRFLTSLHVHSSSDISPVLLDIQHAISAKSPSTLYTPGPGTYLWLCFFNFSPTSIFDYFNKKFFNSDVSMPRTLSMPNQKNEVM
ncbi:17-beta-hydroxysteroid dehydrogenase type 2 isoform X1 [Artibeus jamaicensis]|uniref:17-beta-hydroxysteroid dehydrogenase type 2 isoform X1 n=1 Tax=Artibeus jamaicensis TaxID=9417 RepID=UPI00235B1339|nr:17-beta-hydroxysteroid dehydrogenase type 2 isoform X1 [Artibeus jamaicensis]